VTVLHDYINDLFKDDAVKLIKLKHEYSEALEKNGGDPETTWSFLNTTDLQIPDIVKMATFYNELHSVLYPKYTREGQLLNKPINPPKVVEVETDEDGEPTKFKVYYDTLTTFVQKFHIPVSFKKIMWLWDWEQQRWRENNGTIEGLIEYLLHRYGLTEKKKIKSIIDEVLTRLSWRTALPSFPFEDQNIGRGRLIPVKNGILDRETRRLYPHSFYYGFMFCLPVRYNPDAECPKIEQFLNSLVPEEDVQILYEIPAAAIMGKNFQVAYMLIGSGSNGKSTYLKLVETLLGSENISNVSLQELCTDKYKTAELVGKLANIFADLPKKAIFQTGKFKMLTGGDRITVEKKYKDPFSFVNRALMIFSANELPEVSDNTYAFWRRWILVEFPNVFPNREGFFEELVTEEELSGFFNKVLQAMTKIEVMGLTRTNRVEELMQEWKKRSNSVFAFVSSCCEKAATAKTSKDDLYNAYVRFCKLEDLAVMAKERFSKEVQRFLPLVTESIRQNGRRVRVWVGVKLKCEGCSRRFECREEEEGVEGVEDEVIDLSGFMA